MGEAEEIWRAKTDEELLEAGEELSEYTADGERIIRAELHRRGLPEPGPPIGACASCGSAIAPNHQGDECPQCGEPLTPGILRALGAVAGRLRGESRAVTPSGQLLTVTWEVVRCEGASFSMLRAKIPGGWLVANETAGALAFVPDAEYKWNDNP